MVLTLKELFMKHAMHVSLGLSVMQAARRCIIVVILLGSLLLILNELRVRSSKIDVLSIVIMMMVLSKG
jgi:hypothetical protein